MLSAEHFSSFALESNAASRRVLEKNGFDLLCLEHHNDPILKRPDELRPTARPHELNGSISSTPRSWLRCTRR
jgi:hypothetical protein